MRVRSLRRTASPRSPRVVVVLGGSSGIGLAAGRAFAALGDHLVLGSRSRPALEAAAAQCLADGAASARAMTVDVSDEASVAAFIDSVIAEQGAIDVVVHAAGTMAYGSIEEIPSAIFARVVETAITGTFNVARAALAAFRPNRRGTLIVVNSLLGSIATPQMGAYITAKWGQAGLVRTLQIETRDAPGVHVCCVSPGAVNTPIYLQAANFTGRSPRPPIPVDTPAKVARAIVRAAAHPRARTVVGRPNRLIIAGFRYAPAVFDALVERLLHRGGLIGRPTPVGSGNVLDPRPAAERERGSWTGRWWPPT